MKSLTLHRFCKLTDMIKKAARLYHRDWDVCIAGGLDCNDASAELRIGMTASAYMIAGAW